MICNINKRKFSEVISNFQMRDNEFAVTDGEKSSMTIVSGGYEYHLTLYTLNFSDGYLTMGNGKWNEVSYMGD